MEIYRHAIEIRLNNGTKIQRFIFYWLNWMEISLQINLCVIFSFILLFAHWNMRWILDNEHKSFAKPWQYYVHQRCQIFIWRLNSGDQIQWANVNVKCKMNQPETIWMSQWNSRILSKMKKYPHVVQWILNNALFSFDQSIFTVISYKNTFIYIFDK